MFSKKFTIYTIIAIGVFLVASSIGNVTLADTDWKGKAQWGDKDHDDNHPTEKQFWNIANTGTMKELAKAIDHMDAKERNINFDKFQETNAWTNYHNSDFKICVVASEDLGNSLADYEVLDCYKNPDYYNER